MTRRAPGKSLHPVLALGSVIEHATDLCNSCEDPTKTRIQAPSKPRTLNPALAPSGIPKTLTSYKVVRNPEHDSQMSQSGSLPA